MNSDAGDGLAFTLERHPWFATCNLRVFALGDSRGGVQVPQRPGFLRTLGNQNTKLFSFDLGRRGGNQRNECLRRSRHWAAGLVAEADMLAKDSLSLSSTVTRRLTSEVGGSSGMGIVSA